MSNRAVAPVLAVLISSLASAALVTSAGAAPAADDKAEATANECLTAPKGETPKGAHWFYRLEKGTKRKCWYLADQVAKTSKVASASSTPAPAPAPSAKPTPPRAPEAAIQPTVANARAELTSRSPKVDGGSDDTTLSETIWPEPEKHADAVTSQSDQGTNIQPATTGAAAPATPPAKDWTMTSRWPDSNLPNGNDSQAVAQPAAETPPQQSAPLQPKPAVPVAATQFHGISLDSTAMLLIILAGVLSIVALAGRMIIKYAGRTKSRNPRRNIWDTAPQESDASHAYESLLQPRNSQFAPVLAEANDPGNEIERLLQRASKRAAA